MYTQIEKSLRIQRISKRVVARRLGMQYRVFLQKVNGIQRFTLDEAVLIKQIIRSTKSVEELFARSA